MARKEPWLDRLKYGANAWRRRAPNVESWVEWIYPYRGLWFTRTGTIFVATTAAIGLAALNTGHNLFYLIFAMLVSLIAVSGVLSERTLRPLKLDRILPSDVRAGVPAAIGYRVENTHAKRSSFGVELRDGLRGEVRTKVAVVDRLLPGEVRTFHVLREFPKRGRVEWGYPQLITRFPFGFFEKIRILPKDDEALVFPAPIDVDRPPVGSDAADASPRPNRLGEEMVNLRPFEEDDDPRRIHWAVSARVGEWMVEEPGRPRDRPRGVFLETKVDADERFERAISRTVGFLEDTAHAEAPTTLYLPHRVLDVSSPRGLREAMTVLALLERVSERESGAGDRAAAAARSAGDAVFEALQHEGADVR